MNVLFPGWNQNKLLLIIGNVMLGIVFIVLSNVGLLPLNPVHFIFFTVVAFLCSLYRPGWMYLLFVGMVPYETVHLMPVGFKVDLRPYQWLAVVLFFAIIVRAAVNRLPFVLVRPRWFDGVLAIIPIGAFVSVLAAPDSATAFKQAMVVLSFGLVYAIARIFWQSWSDAAQAIPFFLSSSGVVFAYALWQNLAFLAGRGGFETMAGRPNAVFSEADWLGAFALVALSVSLALVSSRRLSWRHPSTFFWGIFQIAAFVTLLISLCRSAWLGAFIAAFVTAIAMTFRRRAVGYGRAAFRTGRFVAMVSVTFLIALGLVIAFHLTPFGLFDRAHSTASGLQTITIACDHESPTLPEKISSTSELESFGCRHINLEEIDNERSHGAFVTEIFRDDPNIAIRQDIYAKTITILKDHWLFGIGWGNIAMFLGTDERGAGLNASNMFLEIWLGSGLAGLVAFCIFWIAALAWSIAHIVRSDNHADAAVLILALWSGLTVFNSFNSGVLLGFFFLCLALIALGFESRISKKNTIIHAI